MENPSGSTKLIFSEDSPTSDPYDNPVIIVGQLSNLYKVKFPSLKHKLEPRVSAETFSSALDSLHPTTSDSVSLYINLATICSLPAQCSRHNAPARPHALTNLIRSTSTGAAQETIIIVCPFSDVVASAVAVARAFPLYSKKTSGKLSSCSSVRVEFILVNSTNGVNDIDYDALQVLADSVRTSARIVDTPCNEMNVSAFIKEVKAVADSCPNLSMSVIRGEELQQKGLSGIYNVGKAAWDPPALVVLTYTPTSRDEDSPVIAWVGKGIVYDTGGLSLKTKLTMPGMKRDCGGAAAVLGAMKVVSSLGFTTELHAVFCLAENSVGSNATRPDDIITLYSGRTVEINNTDAEGRLVLADGVVYASRDLKASVIFDMATLTGAQAITTGKYHGAVLTNSQLWESKSVNIGRLSGDLIFPILFAPELHFPEFNSSLADMKNSVNDRANAQSSCAGLFILSHLGFDFKGTWIHVDMAAPVHSGERATGYGVVLLSMLFGEYSSNDNLRQLVKTSLSA